MTSADFLTHRKRIHFRTSPGKVNCLWITPAASTYLCYLKLFGLRNDVLTHPDGHASYAVPVRRYRYLQSRLLQCMDHSKPPCGLLKLRSVTSAFKRLSLSGFSLIRTIFIIQGTHIGLAIGRLKCFYETFVQGSTLVILLNFSAENPPHRQAVTIMRHA